MKIPFKEIQGIRIVSSGTTTIPASGIVVLDTKVLNANEAVYPALFITNNVSSAGWGEGNYSPSSSDHVSVCFRRTSNANELVLTATNNNSFNSRTVRWAIIAIQL